MNVLTVCLLNNVCRAGLWAPGLLSVWKVLFYSDVDDHQPSQTDQVRVLQALFQLPKYSLARLSTAQYSHLRKHNSDYNLISE